MESKEKMYSFIKWSCEISPNVLDWIRSIYFSLLGSSMLTFCLKASVLSPCAFVIFSTGVLSFGLALFVSVSIANRFKRHEKNYDGLTEAVKISKKPEPYYYEQEIDTKNKWVRNTEHFLLYFLWIPAFICVACAGFYMESKSAKSSSDMKEEILNIKTTVGELDSSRKILIDITQTNKQLQDSLKVINISNGNREKQIDSLKKVIKTVTAKPKPIPIQKEIK